MKNNKKTLITFLKVAIIVLACIIVGPLLINCLYKIRTNNNFFIAEWSAGEFLGYYGSVLSFCSTGLLSVLAIWQTHIIRLESDNHTKKLEEIEKQKNQPLFYSQSIENDVAFSNMKIEIKNVSSNIAQNLNIEKVEIKRSGDVINYTINEVFNCILPNEAIKINIHTPHLYFKDELLIFFSCQDIYGIVSKYTMQTRLDTNDSRKTFIIKKISKNE